MELNVSDLVFVCHDIIGSTYITTGWFLRRQNSLACHRGETAGVARTRGSGTGTNAFPTAQTPPQPPLPKYFLVP